MRAARAIAKGKFEFIDVPTPDPAPGKVLVRLERIGICGSDLELICRDRDPSEYPLPVGFSGHEVVGTVEESGPDTGFEPGDRVLVVPPDANCYVEWFLSDPGWLVKQPQGVDPELLVCAQQLGTGIHLMRKLPQFVDQDVVILGQGPVGLILTALFRMGGARKIIGVDVVDYLLDASRTMGATHTVNSAQDDVIEAVEEITGGELADIAVEAVGIEETANQCLYLLKKFGIVVPFGVAKQDTYTFHYKRFLRRQLRAIASDRTGDEPGYLSFKLAADYVAQGRIDLSPLITHRMPFEELQKGFDMQLNKTDKVIRVILEV